MDKAMFSALVVLAVAVAFVYAVYFVFVVAGTFKRKPGPASQTGSDGPACGRCGYLVRGIPSFTCPECGSDLREVGIDVGKRGPAAVWVRLLALLIGWSIVVPVVGGVIVSSIQQVLPRWMRYDGTVTMDIPKSLAYLSVKATLARTGRVDTQPPRWASDVIHIELDLADGNIAKLDYEGNAYRYRTSDTLKSGTSPLNGVLVSNWMKDAGIAVDNQVLTEATEIASAVRGLTNSAPMGNGSRSSSGGIYRNFDRGNETVNAATIQSIWGPILTLALVVVWIVGVWMISRRVLSRRRAT